MTEPGGRDSHEPHTTSGAGPQRNAAPQPDAVPQPDALPRGGDVGAYREEILRRIRTSVDDRLTVINYLDAGDLASPDLATADVASPDLASPDLASPDLASPDQGGPTGRWARWRARRRSRARRRRAARRPAAHRIEFSDWAAIPWRDRPDEARLVDVAHQIAAAVEQSPAWRHPELDAAELRLDVRREVAGIAAHAYRLFQARSDLGQQPDRGDDFATRQAQAIYAEHRAAIDASWGSLVDRVTMLRWYQIQLAAYADALAAESTIRRLDAAGAEGDIAGLTTAAVTSELAADEIRRLTDRLHGASSSRAVGAPLLPPGRTSD